MANILTWEQLTNIVREIKVTPEYSDISEIIPGKLYLGNWAGSLYPEKLIALGIKAVLCVNYERNQDAATLAAYAEAKIATQYLEVDELSSIRKHFQPAYDFIATHIRQDGVYVHCTAGSNRSPTLVAYYLLREIKGSTVDLILAFLERKRYCVSPMTKFIADLRWVEQHLTE